MSLLPARAARPAPACSDRPWRSRVVVSRDLWRRTAPTDWRVAPPRSIASPLSGAAGWRRVMEDRRCRLASTPELRCGKSLETRRKAEKARSTLGTDGRHRPKGARHQDKRAQRRQRPGAWADGSRGVPYPSPATFPKANRYPRGATPNVARAQSKARKEEQDSTITDAPPVQRSQEATSSST